MRLEGRHWHVWRARGPTRQRQLDANRAGCVAAFEQHLNAVGDKEVLHSLALVAKNGSEKSKAWARDYTARVAEKFGIKDGGIVVDPPRGGFNVQLYSCPSILLEPGFISHYDFANRVQIGEGLDALAECAVDSVCAMFPEGGLVAVSCGHLYRGTGDKGAKVNDGDDEVDPLFDEEGELNDQIVFSIEEMLVRRLGPHERPTDPAPPNV